MVSCNKAERDCKGTSFFGTTPLFWRHFCDKQSFLQGLVLQVLLFIYLIYRMFDYIFISLFQNAVSFG